MMVSELFLIASAKSRSSDDYVTGTTPFVTSTQLNNGIVRYVEPYEDDKVFEGPAICVSGLGYATLQLHLFLPKGNGGDSCCVLTPRNGMSKLELLYYTALFNVLHKWRFSFGRKANRQRIERLLLSPLFAAQNINFNAVLTSAAAEIDRSTTATKNTMGV